MSGTQNPKEVFELLSLKNSVFTTYIVWTSILVIKLMFMSVLTGIQRARTKVSFSRYKFHVLFCKHMIVVACV